MPAALAGKTGPVYMSMPIQLNCSTTSTDERRLIFMSSFGYRNNHCAVAVLFSGNLEQKRSSMKGHRFLKFEEGADGKSKFDQLLDIFMQNTSGKR